MPRPGLPGSVKPLAETETGSAEEQPVRDRLIHVQPCVPRIDSLKPSGAFFYYSTAIGKWILHRDAGLLLESSKSSQKILEKTGKRP